MRRIPSKQGVKADNSRLYRHVVEACRKLEIQAQQCSSVSELFNGRHDLFRSQLNEQAENLLFQDPVEFGRKAEELKWRRNYHDFMQVYKRFRKHITPNEASLLEAHLISGIGHYESLLKRFALKYGIDTKLFGVIGALPAVVEYGEDSAASSTRAVQPAAKAALQRMLVYTGDIYRYLNDLGNSKGFVLAAKWYNMAISFDQAVGMPFNQLGTLFGSNNYGLDSAYFYIRCLETQKPFEGASSNLMQILLANSQVAKSSNVDSNSESSDLVKLSIAQFLYVTKEFWTGSTSSTANLAPMIGKLLDLTKQALSIPEKLTTNSKPTFLSSSMIYEMGVTSLIIVHKFQDNEDGRSSASVAFALNFLYLLIEQNIQWLSARLETLTECETLSPNVLSGSQSTSKDDTPDLSPRRALSKLRRRKAAINFDDADAALIDFEDDSDMSELEETALSTIDALDISSDVSDSGSVCNDISYGKDGSSDDGHVLKSNLLECSSSHVPGILESVYMKSALPTIKIFFNWLRINHKLMKYCMDSFKDLFCQIQRLLNLLLAIEGMAVSKNPNLRDFIYTGNQWMQKFPLTADLGVQNLNLLQAYQSQFIDFNAHRHLSTGEMSFLCMQDIIAFGHFLVANVHESGLSFDLVTRRFIEQSNRNGFAFETEAKKPVMNGSRYEITSNGFERNLGKT